MAYSLKLWTNPRDTADERLYINGTTRSAVYFARSKTDGRVVWSSKAHDTPAKFRTGDHYGKCRKDGDAAEIVAEAFGVEIGEGTGEEEWSRLVAIARGGLIVEAR